MRKFLYLLFLIFLFLGCSSSILLDDVTVCLPQWNNNKVPISAWEVSVFDGEERSLFYVDGNARVFSVSLAGFSWDENRFFTVLARPVNLTPEGKEFLFFEPAGSVYPQLASRKGRRAELNLTFENGFTAAMANQILTPDPDNLYSVERRRSFCENFNWERFSTILMEKELVENYAYNPWFCNKGKIVSSITGKSFSSIYLNMKDSAVVNLPVPWENCLSSYVPENSSKRGQVLKKGTTNQFLYTGNASSFNIINILYDGKNLSVSAGETPILKER